MKHIKFAIFTLILFSISSAFGQKDTSHFSVSTIGIEFNTLGSSRRFIQVPHSVANSSFYQDNFKNFGNENREFSILRMGTQIGGTVGVKFNFIKKIDAQLSIGLGYQNSSKYRDSVVKEVTDYDASGIPFTFISFHLLKVLIKYFGPAKTIPILCSVKSLSS